MAKTTNYRRWLREQLANLDDLAAHPDPEQQHYDDVRSIIKEAGRRAAVAGVPGAVRLCNVRRGGQTVATAREILAGCVAELPVTRSPKRDRLTPPEVAKRYGVSSDTVRKWIEDGELVAVNVADPKAKRPRLRIKSDALAEFDKRRTAKAVKPSPRKRRRKTELGLLVKRFSS